MRMLGLQLALLLTMGSAMGAAAGQSPASGPMPAANAVTPAAVSDPAQTDSTVSADVGAEQMEQLPESGRDWRELQLLTPAANDPGSALDASGAAAAASYRGMATTQNGSVLDGVSDEQNFRAGARGAAGGGSRAEYTFSSEAVREFRVSAHGYSAEYGNGVGGTIQVVSRSGANQLHGSGTYLLRTSALDAANPFSVETHYTDGVVNSATVKPHDLRQQVAGSVGGALRRDRLFYFYAFDGMRRGFPAVSAPAYPEFYALTPTQHALLGTRGVSAAQTNAALNYIDSLSGNEPRSSRQTVNFGKLDWQRTPKERWSLEYNRLRSRSPRGIASEPVVARGRASLGEGDLDVDALVGRWTRLLSPRLNQELRAQFSRDFEYETAQTPLAQEPAISPGGFAPQVTIGDVGASAGMVYGTPAALGRRAYPDERREQVVEALTWTRGRQQWTLGFNWSRVHDLVETLPNAAGSFRYDSGVTSGHAGGLVDWITDYTFNVHAYPNGGCPSIADSTHEFCFRTFTQSFGEQQVAFNMQQWAGYAQTTWRAGAGFTLSAGLRWEYELLPLPQQPNLALDAVFGAAAATNIFPEDRNNLGPRVGLAWAPEAHSRRKLSLRGTVVHAGYGLFFGRLPGTAVRAALANTALPQTTTSVRITPSTITQCPQVTGTSQGFGYPCAYTAEPPQAVARTTSALAFGRRFRLPAMQQGELAVEHSLPRGITLSASGLLDRAVQLPNSVDINILPSTALEQFVVQGGDGRGARDGETFVVPVYTQRVDPAFGPVTAMVSNANAVYSAMVLEARQHAGGLELRASWTWSKAIDYGESSGAAPRTNNQFDPFNLRYDRGLSSLNHPHKLVASAVWQPRFAWSGMQPWSARVLNGWSLSGVLLETSGRPYSYRIFGGTRLSGGRESLNGSGGATYLPTVGRNTLRLPDTATLDLRLARTVRVLGGRASARIFAQGFNVLNRQNFSSVTQRAFLVGKQVAGQPTPLIFQDAAAVAAEGLNTRPFGAPTATATNVRRERQVELGVRVQF